MATHVSKEPLVPVRALSIRALSIRALSIRAWRA
jgi:hypothetical protein